MKSVECDEAYNDGKAAAAKELQKASRKESAASASATSAQNALATADKRMVTLHNSLGLLEAKVKSLRDALKLKTAEHDDMCSTAAEAMKKAMTAQQQTSTLLSEAAAHEATRRAIGKSLSVEIARLAARAFHTWRAWGRYWFGGEGQEI